MTSMIINPFIISPPFISAPLGTVIASCCADLDATIAASYGGSGQTWANYEPSPADGASQIDYDFHLGADSGASTDDPTFTGIAGADDAYFAVDGGDFFAIKSTANATTIKKMHRTDASGTWIAFAFQTTGTPTGVSAIWGNRTSDRGFSGLYDPDEKITITQEGDTVGVNFNGTEILSGSTDYLVIFSWDGTSGTNNVKLWLNSATVTQTVSMTFNASTTDETASYTIAARLGSNILDSGSRVYGNYIGNEFLDDTKAAIIRTHLQTRHVGTRY